MQLQLINGYAFNPQHQGNAFMIMLDEFLHMFNTVNDGQSDANKIKYFIENLKRPLLEELYNYTFQVSRDEEDSRHIHNSIYFHQELAPRSGAEPPLSLLPAPVPISMDRNLNALTTVYGGRNQTKKRSKKRIKASR